MVRSRALADALWLVRWLRWWLGWPGYRFGDPLLGDGEVRDKNRRLLRERYEANEPRRPE